MSYARQKGYITKPPVGSQLDRTHHLSRGLVSFYLFNEGSGSGINDLARPNKVAEAIAMDNTNWRGSEQGIILRSDGSDYVKAPGFTTKNVGSLVFKVRQVAGSAVGYIFDTGDNTGQRTYLYDYSNSTSGGWTINQISITTSGLADLTPAEEWTTVAFTWDNSLTADKQKVYQNGKLFATFNVNVTNASFTQEFLYLFRRQTAVNFFTAGMDFFRYYDRAISQGEAEMLHCDSYADVLRLPMRRVFSGEIIPPAPPGTIERRGRRRNIPTNI